jgi:hypothetical protein
MHSKINNIYLLYLYVSQRKYCMHLILNILIKSNCHHNEKYDSYYSENSNISYTNY